MQPPKSARHRDWIRMVSLWLAQKLLHMTILTTMDFFVTRIIVRIINQQGQTRLMAIIQKRVVLVLFNTLYTLIHWQDGINRV